MAGLFGGGAMPVHAGVTPSGGLYGAATNFLGGIGKSIGNFFNPTAQAQTPPLVKSAQAYTGGAQPALAPFQAQVTQAPTQPSYSPQVQQQNYAPVAQAEGALSSYLAGRDPAAYLTQQYQQLGIPDLQKVLGNETSDILQQQTNLTDLPKADIARRSDSGMLTAAQRNALTASEQSPIRDQLLRSQQANSADTTKLNSLLQLANNYLGAYNQGTQQGEMPLQNRITGANAAYSAAENAANRQPTAASETAQNRQQSMQAAQSLSQDVRSGATLQQIMGKYLAAGLIPDTILSLYNSSGSRYGPAKETAAQLTQRYGVSSGRGA